MKTEEIVQKLINGETISVPNETQANEVRVRLLEIKKNCTTVLSQLREMLN